MSYAKTQEYRLMRRLKKIDGVKILHYYGSRTKNSGDFLIESPGDIQIRIDHKSTTDTDKIRLEFKWLYKLQGQNMARQFDEGLAIPLITFSIKSHRAIYCLTDITLFNIKLIEDDDIYNYNGTTYQSILLTTEKLNGYVHDGQGLVVGHQKFVYVMEDFIGSF
jgi:hypothetical protein